MTVDIIVKNKIARPADRDFFFVCGNSDYVINFSFDEEWNEYEEKTAFFIAGGVTLPPVIFQGNACPVPVLQNVDAVAIGVSAGNLHTTTKAVIPCRKSIRCESSEPQEPAPDVYAQLMQMINDGKVKGEKGENGTKFYLHTIKTPDGINLTMINTDNTEYDEKTMLAACFHRSIKATCNGFLVIQLLSLSNPNGCYSVTVFYHSSGGPIETINFYSDGLHDEVTEL